MQRKYIIYTCLTVIVAVGSFALFNWVSRQPNVQASQGLIATAVPSFPTIGPPTPDARLTATPLPLPVFTPWGTPLPTPIPNPTWTPTPIVPTPVWTAIPPTVTQWITFTGKSGFSLSYPAGWYVKESVGVQLPENQSAVTISILNYDPANIPPNTIVVPGALAIQLLDFTRGEMPANGTQFMVGLQKLPGVQIVYGRDDPRVEPQFRVFEQEYAIHFNAGGRRWVISGTMYPPKEGVAKYTEIFHQIVGSLRYETK